MKFTALFAVCLLAMLTGSCSSSKTSLPYFTDIASIKEGTLPQSDYMPKIKPDDELFISVNSLNPEATAAYNLGLSNPATVTLLPNTTLLHSRPMWLPRRATSISPCLARCMWQA